MRLALSAIGGVIIAFGLFLLMNNLIGASETKVAKPAEAAIVDFVRLNEVSEVQTKQRKRPEKPTAAKPRPPSPRIAVSRTDKPQGRRLNIVTPNIKVPVSGGGGPYLGGVREGQVMGAEGDIIPILRIAPQYPRAARVRGTEGWVTVRFIINEDGTVSDPSVLESQPPRVFDREAIRAIRRWKFKPRIVNGVPVKRGAEQTIEFKMDGS